ncbi:MAG: hypothetical protein AB1489_04775 [Acidobacteriota bacterium]
MQISIKLVANDEQETDFDDIELEPLEDSETNDANVQQMLAEASFLEGEELLACGNRSGALNHYRDAINYAPQRIDFYLKLSEVLNDDLATIVEAQQILVKAIELAPTNLELRVKLQELREHQGRAKRKTGKLLPINPPPKITSPLKIDNIKKSPDAINTSSDQTPSETPLDYETTAIINAIVELEKKNTGELTQSTKKSTKVLRQSDLALYQEDSPYFLAESQPYRHRMPKKFWIILMVAALLLTLGLIYQYTLTGEIKPLAPIANNSLAAQEILFQWHCDKPNLSFALEVYNKGELIIRHITREHSYRPDISQLALFQANQTYTWVVRTNPYIKQRFDFIASPQEFRVNSALTPTPASLSVPEPAPHLEEHTPNPTGEAFTGRKYD